MNRDVRDVPVSAASPAALAGYEKALRQFQSYVGDPVATLDATLAESPGFVMGHLFKALALFTASEKQFLPAAGAALAAAVPHLAAATERERTLAAGARSLLDGDWEGGTRLLDRVLAEHPRDVLALQVAHLTDFYRGDALNLRNRVSRVLPAWDASVPGYSYVLGMQAFGLEEMNQYAEAEDSGRRALALQRCDAWAVHAVAHVMEMQGRIDEGMAWLASREADWAPDNGFAFHNWWHWALFHLDGGHWREALALYDRAIHPQPQAFALPLVDATALLWRLHLEDIDVGGRFAAVADEWEARLQAERGFYAFNEVHAVLAFAATGRGDALARQMASLEDAARRDDTNGRMSREVGVPLARAFAAFGAGRYAGAIDAIEPVRDIAHRFGGSHAQRDIVTLTLVEAALRGGRHALARHYLAERQVHKPRSAWAGRLLGRTRTTGARVLAAA